MRKLLFILLPLMGSMAFAADGDATNQTSNVTVTGVAGEVLTITMDQNTLTVTDTNASGGDSAAVEGALVVNDPNGASISYTLASSVGSTANQMSGVENTNLRIIPLITIQQDQNEDGAFSAIGIEGVVAGETSDTFLAKTLTAGASGAQDATTDVKLTVALPAPGTGNLLIADNYSGLIVLTLADIEA